MRRLMFALLLAACMRTSPRAVDGAARAADAASPHVIVKRRKCMGTVCEFQAFAIDDAKVEAAFSRGLDEFDRLEALMTSWRPNSEVSRVNDAAGKEAVKVSPDTLAVIRKAQWVSKLTDGAFDITVGVYKGLWKFDEDNDGTVPARKDVERRRKLVNWQDVIVDEAAGTVMLRRAGQRMNLEGLAKGYAVDAAVKAIRDAGVRDFIVHAGGDLFAAGRRGTRAWRVGIQDPRGPHGKIIYELSLSDQAFNTSGDYERFVIKDGVRYHHILDARTGFPARGMRAITVLASDAFTADTLDTALFAVGPERALKIAESLSGVEVVIIDAKNSVLISTGLQTTIVKRGDPTPGG